MRHTLLLAAILFFATVVYGQNGTVKGNLTDTKGEALQGAVVHLLNTSINSVSEEDGSFTLLSVPAGNHRVVITYIGLSPDTLNVIVQAGQTLKLKQITLRDNTHQINDVVITSGLKQGGEAKAINIMKNSERLVTVVSSENISKYPDHNAAEALKRVASAAVQYDKGEGAYISLRGTPLDWTATLVNGDRLPVADEENFTRTFEFEVLPSNLIDYIEVARTSTPDLDGDNVGGAINFITKKQVDHRQLEISSSLGLNFLTLKPSGDFHLLWADQSKNKKFSYAINGSYYERSYGAQAYLLNYGSNFNQGISRFDLKDYSGTRQTAGAHVFLQYKFNEKFTLSGKGLAGTMLDDKWQNKQMYIYTSGDGSTVDLQSIHGKLNRLLTGGTIEAEYKPTSRLKFNLHVSSFSNKFWYGNVPYSNSDPRNGYFTAEFALPNQVQYKDADYINLNGTAATPGSTSLYYAKLLDLDNPYGHGDNYRDIKPQFDYTLNNDSFQFRRLFTEINKTLERNPIVAQLDGTYAAASGIKIQAGAKFYWKQGERDVGFYQWQQPQYNQQSATPIPMTSLSLQPFDARGGYLPEYGSPYTNMFMSFLTHQQLGSIVNLLPTWREYNMMDEQNQEYWMWVGSSYKYHEYTSSGYVMANATVLNKLNITGGLRIEDNIMQVSGDTLDTKPTIDYSTGYVYYKTVHRTTNINNVAVLPSLNLTYSIRDNQNLRFAVSRTYHRQNFAEVKPGAAVIDYSNFYFTFGNPNLKPTYSVNLDLAYEYFWGNKGMFSVGTYYKNITNHIFATNESDFDPVSGIIYKSFQNSGKSWVWGAEAMIKRQFTFLPKFLSGFGVDANITYSVSRMEVPGRPKSQPMAEQTPLLYNVALYYEKYGLSARLALNYTGAFLSELNLASVVGTGLLHTDGSYDVYMGKNYSLDAQAAYTFKKHYTVFVEANNLLDWPYLIYRGDPRRPMRVEYYRQRGAVGFKFEL